VIHVADPGPQTTVQDLGRFGQLRSGIPPSGPVDVHAFVIANRLVGNPDNAAGLECTVLGPRFTVEQACAIAVTGAEAPVTVNDEPASQWATLLLAAGARVRIGAARAGVRVYVAFSGGLDVPKALGSCATFLRGRLGGLAGRSLKRGDTLKVLPAPRPLLARRLAAAHVPPLESEPEIRVVLGPQADRFTAEGLAAFLSNPYEMLPQSDRMGARLSGPPITHSHGHDIVSDGIALGSIQVPGDGQPIVLLVDRQSTGGYTKVATVGSFDIGRIGQVKPAQRVRFRAVEVAEAHRLRRQWEASMAEAAGGPVAA
jgi:antagonist of KipI